MKWEGAATAIGVPKYMVCNADESEPGTFKDRVLIEGDPHRVLEGLIIAAFAVGADHSYIYLRGEYPYAYKVMEWAIDEARQAGYLGENILGSGFDCEVELRRGQALTFAGRKQPCSSQSRASAVSRYQAAVSNHAWIIRQTNGSQ